jgi:vancomycin resistance protein VanW
MKDHIEKTLQALIYAYENPERKALSLRFPHIKKPILQAHFLLRHVKNGIKRKRAKKTSELFPYSVTKHQSVLRRKLGDSNPLLQERKIINIKNAINHIDQIVIRP